jgi:hypothetical protein
MRRYRSSFLLIVLAGLARETALAARVREHQETVPEQKAEAKAVEPQRAPGQPAGEALRRTFSQCARRHDSPTSL